MLPTIIQTTTQTFKLIPLTPQMLTISLGIVKLSPSLLAITTLSPIIVKTYNKLKN